MIKMKKPKKKMTKAIVFLFFLGTKLSLSPKGQFLKENTTVVPFFFLIIVKSSDSPMLWWLYFDDCVCVCVCVCRWVVECIDARGVF